ncbi:MAG: hypothetical protein AB9866_24005 [Syntrophobacteraceae bacterium]
MRKSDIFFLFMAINLVFAGMALVHSHSQKAAILESIKLQAGMVRQLALTDLCLFTEARYTRHPSQADRHTPFQDHPMSLEHFPTGSIVAPPDVVKGVRK